MNRKKFSKKDIEWLRDLKQQEIPKKRAICKRQKWRVEGNGQLRLVKVLDELKFHWCYEKAVCRKRNSLGSITIGDNLLVHSAEKEPWKCSIKHIIFDTSTDRMYLVVNWYYPPEEINNLDADNNHKIAKHPMAIYASRHSNYLSTSSIIRKIECLTVAEYATLQKQFKLKQIENKDVFFCPGIWNHNTKRLVTKI